MSFKHEFPISEDKLKTLSQDDLDTYAYKVRSMLMRVEEEESRREKLPFKVFHMKWDRCGVDERFKAGFESLEDAVNYCEKHLEDLNEISDGVYDQCYTIFKDKIELQEVNNVNGTAVWTMKSSS